MQELNKNEKILYKTEYFFNSEKIELNEYLFDSFDKKLCFGNKTR